MVAFMIPVLLPFWTIGRIYQKSPPSSIVFPPKGFIDAFVVVSERMSYKVLLNASRQF